MRVLGIDIGGSALKGAPVDTVSGRLLAERCRIPTPKPIPPRTMAEAIGEMVRHFRWRGPIGIGFPGVIQGSRTMTSANLHPDFIDFDAGSLFGKAAGRKVALTNDAAAAAMAEMKFGQGAGFDGKVLLLTLGTGVGTELAYRGVVFPCELGHLPFHGHDAEKRVAASVKAAKDLSWKQWGRRLGKYVAVLERLLWPELIIVGGGVSAEYRRFFKYVAPRAPIVPAKFLNEAGIVGAALWAAEPKRRA